MKKSILNALPFFIAGFFLVVVSCKKNDTSTTPATTNNTTDDTGVQTQNGTDDSRVNSDMEQADVDVNDALSASSTYSMKINGSVLPPAYPCGATVDTSQKSSGIVILTYDGTSVCNGDSVKRSGSVKIELLNYPAMKWIDTNATAKITYTNYKVTPKLSNKSFTYDGVKYISNLSGGLVYQMSVNTVVHKIRANNISITFDDGKQKNWSIARTKLWKNLTGLASSPFFEVTVSGDTTVTINSNGYSNVAVWGVNRNGDNFAVQITTPVKSNAFCGWYRPTSGVRTYSGIAHTLTVTYGVDASGVVLTSGCAYGFRLNWVNAGGQSKSVVVAY